MQGVEPTVKGVDAAISAVGEKRIIREFIKPFFNVNDNASGVGDDCAMVAFGRRIGLFSTDRVPADLTAFRLGILDYRGLGDYLARLNLSDIAACGGLPRGLLLNLGLPRTIRFRDVQALCAGFRACGGRFGVEVLGGDITDALELSISATSIGESRAGQILTRRNAKAGDSIFISRPLGLTPAAFAAYSARRAPTLTPSAWRRLDRQFTHMQPLITLGRKLAKSRKFGACMDNTDGVGQTLSELAEASRVSFVIERDALRLSPLVRRIAASCRIPELELAFGAGADFSLIGTLRGSWSNAQATEAFGHSLQIIGRVEKGRGVWLEADQRHPLSFQGWNYFSARLTTKGARSKAKKGGR